ncbi:hypothetical protein SDC9_167052 [bioreactor metagenome]|uniref:Uncharacterized protein n=1 Tax=bioreactor metagenome TaxID=1076179 RepID=A0A645G1B5_9ZZZZ
MLHAAGDILLGFLVDRARTSALFIEIAHDLVVVVFVGHLVDGRVRERLELIVDGLWVVPAADSAVVHKKILLLQ